MLGSGFKFLTISIPRPMSQPVTILLVEDSGTTQRMVEFWLADGLELPYALTIVDTLSAGLEQLTKSQEVQIAIVDLNLPDSAGLDTFRALQAARPLMPIVIMSGDDNEEIAVAAVREGAQDYIVKGSYSVNPLIRPIRFALERVGRQRAESELRESQQQIFLASAIQQELFPKDGLEVPGFDVDGRCDPADSTGGDYYDFFEMLNSRWGIVIGDVSGHGLPAALFMIGVRAVLRALVTSYGDVGFVVSRADKVLQDDLDFGRFVTLFFLSLDPETRSFRFAAAGHPGYLFDTNGDLKETLTSTHLPLGISPDLDYESSPPVTMSPGELLVLFTDGVNELMNPANEMFGNQRVFDLVKANREQSAAQIVEMLFAESSAYAAGRTSTDDVTVVVVKCVE